MSFILDALRKSENERQRGAVPSVTRVPMAARPNRLPAWAVGLMLMLGASVVALGGAWWQLVQRSAERPALGPIELAIAPERLEMPATQPEETPAGRSRERGAAIPLRRLAEPSPQTAQSPASPSASPSASPPAPPSASQSTASQSTAPATPAQPAARIAEAALPTAAELAGEGVSLPSLVLQLHAYSDDPGQRFVFINGNRYAEGETLSEGPRVVSIYTGGAILNHRGTEFRLPRD